MVRCLGLDIGGANVKAVHSSGGQWTIPYPLWQAPDQLAGRLDQLIRSAAKSDVLAVTMTAELCDCFATKRQGVCHVLDAVLAVAGDRRVLVWQTSGRFVDPQLARADPLRTAAANWHALASYLATRYQEGAVLMIDIGSTTTDIVWLHEGRPWPKGLTDTERLATGELVYLGCRRTLVMALGPTIPWRGQLYGVMAERFASTADIYVLTGQSPENPHDTDTADGQPMTRHHAAARLLRMIGGDLETHTHEDATALAGAFVDLIHQRLTEAILQVTAGRTPKRVVISGSGDFIAIDRWEAWSKSPYHRLADTIGEEASVAACAYALVKLAEHQPFGLEYA